MWKVFLLVVILSLLGGGRPPSVNETVHLCVDDLPSDIENGKTMEPDAVKVEFPNAST